MFITSNLMTFLIDIFYVHFETKYIMKNDEMR